MNLNKQFVCWLLATVAVIVLLGGAILASAAPPKPSVDSYDITVYRVDKVISLEDRTAVAQTGAAIELLRRAKEAGFRDFDRVRSDPAGKAVGAGPRRARTSRSSRDESPPPSTWARTRTAGASSARQGGARNPSQA